MTQNHVTEKKLWKNPKKLSKQRNLQIFFNEAGQNLVESVQNSKKKFILYPGICTI